MAILRSQIEKLEVLRSASPEVVEALAHAQQVWSGDRGWVWLLRFSAVLGAVPIDLLARGEVSAVRKFLGRIGHGIAA